MKRFVKKYEYCKIQNIVKWIIRVKNVKGIFCDICRLHILLETMNTSRKYYTSDDNKHIRCEYSMFPKFEYDDS